MPTSSTTAIQPSESAVCLPGSSSTVRASFLFALTFVVIPNLAFLAASIFFVPERIIVAPFYLAVGLLAPFVPVGVTALLLAGVAAFDWVVLICRIFFLSPSLALSSLRFMFELDLSASWLYIAFAFTTLATVVAMVWMTARYRRIFRQARLVPAALALAALIGVDGAVNHTWAMFFPAAAKTPPFDSALRLSGISSGPAASGERNLLLVLVEGFGAFADPAHRALFDAKLLAPEIQSRFALASGTSPYVGSTTGAELRELCGRWGDYRDYLQGGPFDCLPSRLHAEGVETIAVHAFSGSMFDRLTWYPKIGFDRVVAEEVLQADHADELPSRCGLTFRGFCDGEVGRVVHRLATEPVGHKRLVYWLTLNTHVPFKPADNALQSDCAEGGEFGDATVCQLAGMWLEIFRCGGRDCRRSRSPPDRHPDRRRPQHADVSALRPQPVHPRSGGLVGAEEPRQCAPELASVSSVPPAEI